MSEPATLRLKLPYRRLVPRWFPPQSARGPLVGWNETKLAMAALQRRQNGTHNEATEMAVCLDPQIAVQIILAEPIRNRRHLESAVLRRPLLATHLAAYAPWADKEECARNTGTVAELAWEFQRRFPQVNPRWNATTIATDAHYAWRALKELRWAQPQDQQRWQAATQQHPLYALLTMPNPQTAIQTCRAQREHSRTHYLCYLLAMAHSPSTPVQEIITLLQQLLNTPDNFTPIEKEIIAYIATSPMVAQEDDTLLPARLLQFFEHDLPNLYLISRETQQGSSEFLPALAQQPDGPGWLMQLLLERPDLQTKQNLDLVAIPKASPQQELELIRWVTEIKAKQPKPIS